MHVMSGPMVKMSRLKKIEMSDPEIADCVQKVGGGAPSSNTIRHYSFICSWKLRGGWGKKNTRAGRRKQIIHQPTSDPSGMGHFSVDQIK